MATPTYESETGTAIATRSTTHNINMPAIVNSGDLLVVNIMFLIRTLGGSLGTTPTGWTLEGSNVTDVGGSWRYIHAVYTNDSDGTEGGTTVDFPTNSAFNCAALVHRISNWGGTLATDVALSASAENQNSNPDPTSLTPSWGSDTTLWLAFYGAADDDATKSADPTSYTDSGDQVAGAGTNDSCECASARRANTTATENPGTFTLSQSEAWSTFTFAVKPATAGGGPTTFPAAFATGL